MSFVLDGIILAVAAVCVISGLRRGFIRSFIGLVKGVASLLVAYAYTPVLQTPIAERFLVSGIANGIGQTLRSLAKNIGSPGYDLSRVAADLPEAYTAILERYHIDAGAFTAQIAGMTEATDAQIDALAREIATPCASAVAAVLSFLALFLGAFVALSLAAWLLDLLFHLPLLSSANSFFGLVFGVAEAVFFAWILSLAGSALITALGSVEGTLFGPGVVEKTYICRFFLTHNWSEKLLELLHIGG